MISLIALTTALTFSPGHLTAPTGQTLTASKDRCQLEANSREIHNPDFTKELAAEFVAACLGLYQKSANPVIWYCHSEYAVCSPLDSESWVRN